MQADPFAVQEYVNLPVLTVNQPQDTLLFQGEGTTVAVTVRAPQSVLNELDASDLHATVDLSSVIVGVETTVPISVTVENEGVRILSYTPGAQALQLEALVETTFPVEIEVEGQAAIGYQASSPTLRPGTISISGPEPYLRDVVSVTGSINIAGAREDISQRVAIVPRNSNGLPVTNVEWEPNQVEVSISVRRRVGYKPDVEVVPDLRGDPALGYRRGSVSVEPSTVTLAGPTSVLSNLPGFIKTLPVSITNATGDLTLRAPLTVPASVVVVETNFVTVNVEILPILSSRTFTAPVEIQGLRQGLQATLSPPEVEVIVEGPETLIAQLRPDSLRVFVNLSGFGLGMHRIDPVVLLPPNITVVSIIPESVEVSLELPPSPTPPPEPTDGLGTPGP